MAGNIFVVEKLSWYEGKELLHDPKVKLRTLALFLQGNGLTVRNLLQPGEDVGKDFQISSADLTDRGLAFMRKGYQKWVRSIDRGGNPADPAPLQREFLKLGD